MSTSPTMSPTASSPGPTPASDWSFIQSVAVDSGQSLVLDIKGGGDSPASGTPVIAYSPQNPPADWQLWTPLPNGMIQSKCATTPALVLAVGDNNMVQVVSGDTGAQNPPAAQTWMWTVNGFVISKLNGLVLDIQGGGYKGNAVEVYGRNDGNNQKWNLVEPGN